MPLDWLNTPLDADIGELIANKKRAKAIETLRRQLQGRLAPPVAVRLQLADLLMAAGRVEEALPVLLGLADEFAGDGFVAKAVAILKRVDRVQPGRADISERLQRLVHQQKTASHARSRPRSALPELGIEEIGEESDLFTAEMELEEEVEPLEAPPPPRAAEALPVTVPEADVEAAPDASAEAGPPATEGPVVVTDAPVAAEPADDVVEPAAIEPSEAVAAEAELPAIASPAAATDGAQNDSEPLAVTPDVTVEPESDATVTPEGEPAPATGSAAPGVGRRIRRALWRFLASLPGGEGGEGGPLPSEPAVLETDLVPGADSEAAAVGAAGEPAVAAPGGPAAAGASDERSVEPRDEGDRIEPPREDAVAEAPAPDDVAEAPRVEPAAAAALAPEGSPAVPAAEAVPPPASADLPPTDTVVAAEPEPVAVRAEGEGSMSEEVFRDQLLDIVEDVLHRPPSPDTEIAMERARTLDLARRLVASRLFQDLSDEELLAIVRGLRLRTCEAGDIVVTEGESGHGLFTLTTGRVKVFVANPDHRNFEVAALGEGDFFGEISSLSGRPRTATVVAATACELLELDRPTLDSIARTHARVRDVLESAYIERASSPEAAAVRAVPLLDGGTSRKAIEVLEAHFGESRWDPRMRLRLADVLLKAGKAQDAIPILIGLADELARGGFADKAVAILKKIEQVQRRNVEVVNLAPLLRAEADVAPSDSPVAAGGLAGALRRRPRPVTDDRFHGWLVDLVRDTVGKVQTPVAADRAADAPAVKAYRAGLVANPLFEGFSEEELVAVIKGLKLLAFEPGDIIITEGEPGQSVFILTTGRVKVFVRGPEHRDVPLATLGEGAFFGEISTLSGRPRSATITAAAACEILELDRAALDSITASHPRVREVLQTFSAARTADPDAARARGARAID